MIQDNSNRRRLLFNNRSLENINYYEKSNVKTDVKLKSVPRDCKKLREKVLSKYGDIFKDKLEISDRVNIPPVHLEIDES